MTLGILVRTANSLSHVAGIARAARARGHEVVIFTTGAAASLLTSPEYRELSGMEKVSISYCTLSARRNNVRPDDIPEPIMQGSQMNNAEMLRNADRIVVL